MLDYELKIDNKKFSGKIDYEKNPENFVQLEMLLKAAPIYYLYKFKNNKDIKSFITPYTALTLIGLDNLYDLIELNTNTELLLDYFANESINYLDTGYYSIESVDSSSLSLNDTLSNFITLCIDEIIETDDFNKERVLNHINELNLNQFINQRRIYNYINEITGACYNLKKKTKTFDNYVSDKIMSLLKILSPKIYNFIKKYVPIINKNNNYCLSCFFSKNKVNQKNLSTIISNNITSILSFLSITPSNKTLYLNNLTSIKNQFIQQFPQYMKNKTRCFAIAENNQSIYFSFSGLWDKDKQIKKTMEDTANNINSELFHNKAIWCKLTTNVLNYVDINSPDNQDECVYIDPPEHFPGKSESFFSCCERKILGEQQNLRDYNFFVMFSPCYKCAKPLYHNYTTITCLLDYNDEDKPKKYKEDLFDPKRYKVIYKDNHYKVVKI